MKKKTIALSLIVLAGLVLFIISSYHINNNLPNNPDNSKINLINNANQTNSGNFIGAITSTDLAKHNLTTSCWVVYKEKVYDLTSWLPKHPGSAESILPYCGNSGFEQAFINKHGTTKVSLFMKVAILIGDLKYQGNLA